MATLLRNVWKSACLFSQGKTLQQIPLQNVDCLTTQLQKLSFLPISSSQNRLSSSSAKDNLPDLPHMPSEGPYPKYEATPSPYKPLFWRRHGYNPNFYQGGLLPRPKEFEDQPLPERKPVVRKSWTRQNALFGQNDYIDILGDGELHPAMLMRGPMWLRATKGNEFQRLLRRLSFEGDMLKEYYPHKYFAIHKQIKFLYNRLNTRRRIKYWGGRKAWRRSRFNNLDKIF